MLDSHKQLVVVDTQGEKALQKAKSFLYSTRRVLATKQRVWHDGATSLTWQVDLDSEQYSWQDSFKYADKLNRQKYGGYSDWRVPSIRELNTILTSCKSLPSSSETGATFIEEVFLESMTMFVQEFWSSSEYSDCEHEYECNIDNAYRARFARGCVGYRKKVDPLFVRCVRGKHSRTLSRKEILEKNKKILQKRRDKEYRDFMNLAIKGEK